MVMCVGNVCWDLLYCSRAGVGTMFALPWYLTWFGHSLNRYSDVVRLYDYFLCAPPLFPVYVTASIVLQRATDVYQCDCDMAMMHCLLSRVRMCTRSTLQIMIQVLTCQTSRDTCMRQVFFLTQCRNCNE